MHDIRIIRDDPESFAKGLARRGLANAAEITAEIVKLDMDLRALLTRLQDAQARRNEASKLIGRAKAQKNEVEAQALMVEVAGLKDEIQAGEESERVLQAALRDRLAQLPNLAAQGVPMVPTKQRTSRCRAAIGARLRAATLPKNISNSAKRWV